MAPSTVDHGYAWVIPMACFFIQGTLFGSYRSYSLLYKVLIDKFDISRSDASWPFSLCMTMIHLTGPISGLLNGHFSIRTITFVGCLLASVGVGLGYFATNSIAMIVVGVGLIQGFGIGLTYVQNSAIINQYFDRYRGTAIGISLSGGTIGAFVMSYVLERSLSMVTFNQCFLVLAVIALTNLPISLLLKPFRSQDEANLSPSSSDNLSISSTIDHPEYTKKSSLFRQNLSNVHLTGFSPKDLFKGLSSNPASSTEAENLQTSAISTITSILSNRLFQLVALTHMSYFWASITYTMVIIDYGRDRGLVTGSAVALINSFSVGDLVGRLSAGLIVDRNYLHVKVVAMSAISGIGLMLFASLMVSDFWAFLAVSTIIGLFSGCINTTLNQLFCHYIGSEKAALCFGLSAFLSGVATLARPLVVGYFRDSEGGSYEGLLVTLGTFALMTGLLWSLEPIFVRQERDKKSSSTATLATTCSTSDCDR